jgi:hypothetical protein
MRGKYDFIEQLTNGHLEKLAVSQCSAGMQKAANGGRQQNFVSATELFTALSDTPSRIHATTGAWLMR